MQQQIVENLFNAIIANNPEFVSLNLQNMGVIGNGFELNYPKFMELLQVQNFHNNQAALLFVRESLNVAPVSNKPFYNQLLLARQQYQGADLGTIAASELAKVLPVDTNNTSLNAVTPVNTGASAVRWNELQTEQKIILLLAFLGLIFLFLLVIRAIQKIIR